MHRIVLDRNGRNHIAASKRSNDHDFFKALHNIGVRGTVDPRPEFQPAVEQASATRGGAYYL
jgi:hypothetical protein